MHVQKKNLPLCHAVVPGFSAGRKSILDVLAQTGRRRKFEYEHVPGLRNAFIWEHTPEGHVYWKERANGHVPLSRRDREQLLIWLRYAT